MYIVGSIYLLTTGQQYNECNDEEYKALDDVIGLNVVQNL